MGSELSSYKKIFPTSEEIGNLYEDKRKESKEKRILEELKQIYKKMADQARNKEYANSIEYDIKEQETFDILKEKGFEINFMTMETGAKQEIKWRK